MSKLLYIQASPRGARSKSTQVADAFVEARKACHADEQVRTVNLFEADLPTFDGLAVQAKYTILHGQQPSAEELEAWRAVERVIDEFKSADRYLLAVPMWNFGIPYRLKQYLDILIQPTYTFNFSPEAGYAGLVTGRPIVVVYARGGEYSSPEAAGLDYQQPYLEMVLKFIGFTDIHSIIVEPTLMQGPDAAEQHVRQAITQARRIAETM